MSFAGSWPVPGAFPGERKRFSVIRPHAFYCSVWEADIVSCIADCWISLLMPRASLLKHWLGLPHCFKKVKISNKKARCQEQNRSSCSSLHREGVSGRCGCPGTLPVIPLLRSPPRACAKNCGAPYDIDPTPRYV